MKAIIPAKVTVGTQSNLEPLIRQMLLEMKGLDGQGGDVTDEELAAAAKAFGEELEGQSADTLEKSMRRTLPQGVKVAALEVERDGMRVSTTTTYALDDIKKLPILRMSFEPGQPRQRPFADISVALSQDGLTIEGMPPPIELNAPDVPEEALREHALSFALRIDLPVLESNAVEDGDGRLIWRFDGARLRDRTAEDRAWIRVKYAPPTSGRAD